MGCASSTTSSASSTEEDTAVPVHGVSQNYIRSLITKHNAEEWTVSEFCDRVVKPSTKDKKCSFARELLSSPETKAFVKEPADVFISYAWKYKMGELFDCLEAERNDQDRFIWLDVVVINQHTSSAVGQEKWLETFSSALKTIGDAELVLMPWEKPIPVGRSWCVFEQFVVTKEKIPFKARMLPKDHDEVVAQLRSGKLHFNTFLQMYASIDCEKSTAFKPEDQAHILELLRSHKAVKATNDATMLSVKKFVADVALAAAKGAEAEAISEQSCNVLHGVGILYDSLGETKKAIEWYEKGLKARRELFQEKAHGDITSSLNDLAACLIKVERIDEAEPLVNECLKLKLQILGEKHPDTIKTKGWAATIEFKRKHFDKALPTFEIVLEESRRVNGRESESVGLTLNNIASCLLGLGRNQEALERFQEALKILEKCLGDSNPQIAGTLNNIAACYDELKLPDQAIEYYEKAVAIQRKTLGNDHLSVGTVLHNLALTLKLAGQNEKAQEYGKEAVKIFTKRLGANHANTKMLASNWGPAESA